MIRLIKIEKIDISYNVMNSRIGFWQKAEIGLCKGTCELTPYLLIITNRRNENESAMYNFYRSCLFLNYPFFLIIRCPISSWWNF